MNKALFLLNLPIITIIIIINYITPSFLFPFKFIGIN
jgi:hypothetical protein